MQGRARRTAGLGFLSGLLALAVTPQFASAADPALQASILRAKRKVLPALVHVKPVQEFYVGGERKKLLATGSGVIISRDGYVLTNHHVIGKGQKIVCVLADEREVPARVVGSDPYTDLAVLQLDAEVLGGRVPFAQFGDSDAVEQGEFVLALGSPFGLTRTISAGVVSTTQRVLGDQHRSIGEYNTWIQTDAAINPGNSGGPLVDLHGRVIGITTRGIVAVAENIGFALPGNLAQEIAEKLIADGKVERSTLGLEFQSIDSVRGSLPAAGGEAVTGAIISDIDRTGPAATSPLRPGDVLEAIDGIPVDGRYDEHIPPLRKRISDMPVGQAVTLRVRRGDATHEVALNTTPLEVYYADEFQAEDWGLTITTVTDALVRRMLLPDASGVHVASAAPGKPGYNAGLRRGDIIYHLDGVAVRDLPHFQQLHAAVVQERRKLVLLEVRNGSFYRFILVKPQYDSDDEPDTAATQPASSEPPASQPAPPGDDPPASQPAHPQGPNAT